MKQKIALFFGAAAMVALTSCGGGWTEENKTEMKSTCTSLQEIVYPDDAKAICDCYVDKLVAQYPKADMTPEQSGAILDECSADAKKKAEAEAERKMQEMLDSMDASMDSLDAAVAE
jgi:gamma-glutamyl:cysteine ligase YbdK (ATP-grasp superfamily)